MLVQQNRLKSPGAFRKALAGRRICSTGCFAVYALPRLRPDTPPRFGFIISKKIHKRANRRNLIKRRLREIVRTRLLATQNAPLPGVIVVVARPGILEASYEEMAQQLTRCFQR